MLVRNGLQGLALVFIVLAIFLDLRLAFWVALGIPVSVFGAGSDAVCHRSNTEHAVDVRVSDGIGNRRR